MQMITRIRMLVDTILSNGRREGRTGGFPLLSSLTSNFKHITLGFMSHRLCSKLGYCNIRELLWMQIYILTLRVSGWQLSPTLPIGVQILMLLTQILTAQHMPPPHWESLSQAWNEINKQRNTDSRKDPS